MSILPRGIGSRYRTFDAFIDALSEHIEKQYEEVYAKEVETILKDCIDGTPIDTGAAAGVEYNSVGSVKRSIYKSHYAFGRTIGNHPGDSGWQLEVEQTKNTLKMSIVNPMWDDYLKFYEFGIVQPLPPATSHWIARAWAAHNARRQQLREEIANG